jgi:hypothetical protein
VHPTDEVLESLFQNSYYDVFQELLDDDGEALPLCWVPRCGLYAYSFESGWYLLAEKDWQDWLHQVWLLLYQALLTWKYRDDIVRRIQASSSFAEQCERVIIKCTKLDFRKPGVSHSYKRMFQQEK